MKYKGYNRFTMNAFASGLFSVCFLLLIINCLISNSYGWATIFLVAMFVFAGFTIRQNNKRQEFLEALNQIDWLEFKYKNGQNIPIGA